MTGKALERLRDATREVHARIDSGPYARAVLHGHLPIARYASFLRALRVVHLELEHALSETPGRESVRAAYSHGPIRRQRLERDLSHLQIDPNGVDDAVLHATVLAQQLRLDARRSAAALFGHLYVLEGSQLGGLALTPALSSRPELQRGGLSYLSGAGRDTSAQFKTFCAALETHLADDDLAIADALSSAEHSFAGFEAILGAVMAEQPETRLVSALNRDAGQHPVPLDLREVRAAFQAGERTRDAWTYYEARYGERGLRFTRSDSAWLVTVAREPPEHARRQFDWLGRMLAARGMPRLLLEQHLEQLHAQLVAALPERASDYVTLLRAASELARARKNLLSDDAADAIARSFAPVGEANCARSGVAPYEAGKLLVAAVLDERLGVARAVEGLCRWLDDPAHCSQDWRAALARTLNAARAAVAT